MKRSLNIVTLVGLFGFAAMAAATGDSKSTSSRGSSESKETPAIEITSVDLFNTYHENEVAADKEFKGKRIIVAGKVESITKDFLDNSIVSMTGDGYFSNVSCNMESEDAAAQLKKGKAYKLDCVCDGMIMGSVQMKNCKMAE